MHRSINPLFIIPLLLFTSATARTAPVDPQYHQKYQWWLEAYELLSRLPCSEAKHFFNARGNTPPPFCDAHTALEGLVSLERSLHPKEDASGLPDRPIPDFSRELYLLEAHEEYRFLHPRAPDGIYELPTELAGKRCRLDTECNSRDQNWRKTLSASPVVSQHLDGLKKLTCEDAALHALNQAQALSHGEQPPEIYAFRFGHCLKSPILCDLSYTTEGNMFAIHPSCLQGAEHSAWLNLRKENLARLKSEGQNVLSKCASLPDELRPTTGRRETLDLLTCFPGGNITPSFERAGILQIPLQQLDPDSLDFYYIERREVRYQEKRGFFGGVTKEKIEQAFRIDDPSNLPEDVTADNLRLQINLGASARRGTPAQQSALRSYLRAWIADRILFSNSTSKELKQALKEGLVSSAQEFMIQRRAVALEEAVSLTELCLKQD